MSTAYLLPYYKENIEAATDETRWIFPSTGYLTVATNCLLPRVPTRDSVVGREGRVSSINFQSFTKKKKKNPSTRCFYKAHISGLLESSCVTFRSGRGITIQSLLTFDSPQKVLTKLDEFYMNTLAGCRITLCLPPSH